MNIENQHSVQLAFPPTLVAAQTTLQQAAVILVKERAGKFKLIQVG